MAKAAGYLTKAKNQDNQGVVKGNRYGISKISRAPEWSTISRPELGIMGQLITEMHNINTLTHGHLFEERNKLRQALLEAKKQRNSNQFAIGQNLEKVRKVIQDIPHVTSKYQIILKGSESFFRFIGWSVASGWNPSNKPISRWADALHRKFDTNAAFTIPKDYLWTDREWTQTTIYYASYAANLEFCQ